MPKQSYVRLLLTGVGATLALLILVPAGVLAANISHAYKTNGAVKVGSLVSLDTGRSDYVVPANVDNGSRLLGVVVTGNDTQTGTNIASGTVQVATTGTASVLVSTLNGNIKVGDQVAVSPFNGVGMKAAGGSRVIGLAQTAFDSGTQGATTETVKTKDGRKHSVQAGYLQISIAIGTNATILTNDLNALQKVVQSITGHTVPTIRIIISIVVAVIALLALITLVYASIYGSIVSIGRNPLAKYAVFKALGSVIGLALLTSVIAGLTIFFLLR